MNTNHQKNIMKFNKTIITYSWSKEPEISHRISGHLFEAIDYFLLNPMTATILIPETIELYRNQIIDAIANKYQTIYHELIFENLVFGRPKVLISPKVILCDGALPAGKIFSEDIELWLCGKEPYWVRSRILDCKFNILTIRYNEEINFELANIIKSFYPDNKNIVYDNTFNKVINPEFYSLPNSFEKDILLYLPGNCRSLSEFEIDKMVDEINTSVNKIKTGQEVKDLKICGVNIKDIKFLNKLLTKLDNIKVYSFFEDELPLPAFHSQFSYYLYTPTILNWDCSSRLIQECIYLDKPIYFTDTVIKKLDTNYGLKYLINKYNLDTK